LKGRKDIPLIRPSVGKEELAEVSEVLASGWLSQGPKVAEFEKRIASYVGAKHAVATSSCTTSLSLALESLMVGKSAETIVPDFTFPATANVVLRSGGVPVFADIHVDTYAVTPGEVLKNLGPRTGAVMPVHPFGHPFEMDEVYEIAAKKGIDVIEDAATAIGTKYRGARVGKRGRAVCFSFHPRKLLTTAEGGCLVTDDDEVYERAISLRNHGQVVRDGHAEFILNGLNYRLSDVHAAIGIAQLEKLDGIISKRRKQAKVYGEMLGESRLDAHLPVEKEWAFHTYQSYVVVLGKAVGSRDRLISRLRKDYAIETQVGTYSLSVQPSFRKVAHAGDLATSRKIFERSLTLPMFEGLSEAQQGYVVESLSRAAGA
jgi:dTDP-4-amino-4,6-dideoxygalactose transaminase